MLTIIIAIAVIIWIEETFGATAAVLCILAGIIGFIALGNKISRDEWRARCKRREFWNNY